MKTIELKSYAKINLFLDIVGKLPNGYHQLDGVMQAIDIFDVVTINLEERKDDKPFKIEITSSSNQIPLNEGNIVHKAYIEVKEKYEKIEKKEFSEKFSKISINIKKNIPVEAGLAGGSGNGGAALLGLSDLVGLELSYDELCHMGGKIGADVPFVLSVIIKANEEKIPRLKGKGFFAARTEGIGDVLTPVTPYEGKILISKPNIRVSTKEVYENINLEEKREEGNVEKLIRGLKFKDFEKIKKNMINFLENYSEKRYNSIVYTKHKIAEEVKAGKVLMSGSGPTVFAISQKEKELEKAFKKIKKENPETFLENTMSYI